MKWIKYKYVCSKVDGQNILLEKKISYSEANIVIAKNEAYNGQYTIIEDSNTIEIEPLSFEFGGTGAKTQSDAIENLGGVQVYTHKAGYLSGSGTNGKFKAVIDEIVSSLSVNGITYSVNCGGKPEMKLIKDCWYTFILDGNVINFNSGGAGVELNFEIVGGTIQPTSPKENTIWVNTSIPFENYQFSYDAPTARADGTGLQIGDVWVILTNHTPLREAQKREQKKFNMLKESGPFVSLYTCKQWDGTEWQFAYDSKIYQNGKWQDFKFVFLSPEVFRLGTNFWANGEPGKDDDVTISRTSDNGLKFYLNDTISSYIVSNPSYDDCPALYFMRNNQELDTEIDGVIVCENIDIYEYRKIFVRVKDILIDPQSSSKKFGFGFSSEESHKVGVYSNTKHCNVDLAEYFNVQGVEEFRPEGEVLFELDIKDNVSGKAIENYPLTYLYFFARNMWKDSTFTITDIWFE